MFYVVVIFADILIDLTGINNMHLVMHCSSSIHVN